MNQRDKDVMKESSVLFSLKELMTLEEDRLKKEEDARLATIRASEAAQAEADRRTREAEAARMRAEADRKLHEEVRAREETARLEAMRQAEVERARVEAESRGRLEQMTRTQAHERELAALAQDKKKKRLSLMVGVGGAVLLFTIVGSGVALKLQADAKADADRRHQDEAAEHQAKIDKLEATARDQHDEVERLKSEVEHAQGAAKAEAQAKLTAAQNKEREAQDALKHGGVSGPGVSGPGAAGPAGPVKPKANCKCPEGDPTCRVNVDGTCSWL